MQRDCGTGKLVPYRYEIVYNKGMSDKEVKIPAAGVDDSLFEEVLSRLKPHGDVRLYVIDKQGYANCIRYTFLTKEGDVIIAKDRRAELGDKP